MNGADGERRACLDDLRVHLDRLVYRTVLRDWCDDERRMILDRLRTHVERVRSLPPAAWPGTIGHDGRSRVAVGVEAALASLEYVELLVTSLPPASGPYA